jgi:hypothetical protein
MLAAVSVIYLLAVPTAVFLGYVAGRHTAKKKTVPWRPIFQLVDHRRRCLGHERARIERELGDLLQIPAWAWGEVFAMRRPLDRRTLRPRTVAGTP